MVEPLVGISAEHRAELQTMLTQLSALWAALTQAAADQDEARVVEIRQAIEACRHRVEEIRRSGTAGSA